MRRSVTIQIFDRVLFCIFGLSNGCFDSPTNRCFGSGEGKSGSSNGIAFYAIEKLNGFSGVLLFAAGANAVLFVRVLRFACHFIIVKMNTAGIQLGIFLANRLNNVANISGATF